MEVPAWKSSLMKYRSKLRSVCHVGKFLPDLRQLLTATEYSCVQNKPDDVSRVDELVRILLTKDERDFEVFCSVLERNGYPRWAKLLNPKGITIDSREQGWATQSAPPVLLYYFILCLPIVHPG